jgi:hypothetical protein
MSGELLSATMRALPPSPRRGDSPARPRVADASADRDGRATRAAALLESEKGSGGRDSSRFGERALDELANLA